MARQTFEKGQRVWAKQWSNSYDEAIVVEPDVAKKSWGYRPGQRLVHYVTIQRVRDGQPIGTPFDVLNSRKLIFTEDAEAERQRAKHIGQLRRDIRDHETYEERHVRYIEHARVILDEYATDYGPDREESLALYLRAAFNIPYGGGFTPKDAAAERGRLRQQADAARQELTALGVELS